MAWIEEDRFMISFCFYVNYRESAKTFHLYVWFGTNPVTARMFYCLYEDIHTYSKMYIFNLERF